MHEGVNAAGSPEHSRDFRARGSAGSVKRRRPRRRARAGRCARRSRGTRAPSGRVRRARPPCRRGRSRPAPTHDRVRLVTSRSSGRGIVRAVGIPGQVQREGQQSTASAPSTAAVRHATRAPALRPPSTSGPGTAARARTGAPDDRNPRRVESRRWPGDAAAGDEPRLLDERDGPPLGLEQDLTRGGEVDRPQPAAGAVTRAARSPGPVAGGCGPARDPRGSGSRRTGPPHTGRHRADHLPGHEVDDAVQLVRRQRRQSSGPLLRVLLTSGEIG